MTAAALCAVGAEKALSNELRKLKLPIAFSGFGRVHFQADLAGLYRALMSLRSADRVLLEAASFQAPDFDALFEGIRAVSWENFIPKGATVVITKVRTRASTLSAATSIQSVSHKAIAERLCAAWGVNRLDDDGAPAELRIYIEKDRVYVLLDLSGEALFRRGYRTAGGTAPLRETLAAAILLLCGWKRKTPLYDPCCGSGTFIAEALLYAWNAAPGLGRSFTLSELAIGDRLVEARVRSDLLDQVNFDYEIRVGGSDIDPKAIDIARANIQRAFTLARGRQSRGAYNAASESELMHAPSGLLPKLAVLDFADAKPAWPDGLLVANPPYGMRLGDRDQAEASYSAMAALAKNFHGWALALISDHPGFESHFGYAADSVRDITNGALRSYLYWYDHLGGRADVDHRRA